MLFDTHAHYDDVVIFARGLQYAAGFHAREQCRPDSIPAVMWKARARPVSYANKYPFAAHLENIEDGWEAHLQTIRALGTERKQGSRYREIGLDYYWEK